MAVATATALAVGSMAVSLGSNISRIRRGNQIARQASRDLNNYQRQPLRNAYAGISVPTQGYTMQMREAQRSQAETAYLASQYGAQGLSMAPRIASVTNQAMNAISAQIVESENRLKMLMAEDEARIRNIREGREQQDIAGIGSRMAYGQSLSEAGREGIVSTLASGAELASTAFGGVGSSGGGGGSSTQTTNVSQNYGTYPAQPWQNRVSLDYNYQGYTPNPNYNFGR